MKHELKLRIEYADAVNCGEKSFEVRKDERGYQKGDTVRFKVIDGNGNHIDHPVEKKEFLICYVLHGWGLEPGWCAFAIGEKSQNMKNPDPEFKMPSIKPADFHASPVLLTLKRIAYNNMPLELGQEVTLVWYDADKGSWRTEDQPVTGVGFEGFRLSSAPDTSPLDSSDLLSWDELGVEVFKTKGLALEEAARRNREGIRP